MIHIPSDRDIKILKEALRFLELAVEEHYTPGFPDPGWEGVDTAKTRLSHIINNYLSMTNAQKPNKHLRTKSKSKTTTKGSRGNTRPKHGSGKGQIKNDKKKKK